MPAYPNHQDIRPFYVTDTDPGAVKAGVSWIDTSSGYVLKIRNDTNTGWNTVSAGGHTHTFETPAGTIDGSNVVFTLSSNPSPTSSLLLYRNGVLQQAAGNDFTLSGNTVTFVLGATPQTGDVLYATYES